MTPELFWLTLTALATALMWVPYILNRIAVRGMLPAMAAPSAVDKPHAPWAERAILAHKNAVENLVVFAPVVLAAHLAGVSTPATTTAAMVFFLARIAHYAIYIAGVPVLRTLVFAVGWLCVMIIGLAAIGWI